jgi:hypothetical protein
VNSAIERFWARKKSRTLAWRLSTFLTKKTKVHSSAEFNSPEVAAAAVVTVAVVVVVAEAAGAAVVAAEVAEVAAASEVAAAADAQDAALAGGESTAWGVP